MSVLGAVLSLNFEDWIATVGVGAYVKDYRFTENIDSDQGLIQVTIEGDAPTDLLLHHNIVDDNGMPANAEFTVDVADSSLGDTWFPYKASFTLSWLGNVDHEDADCLFRAIYLRVPGLTHDNY